MAPCPSPEPLLGPLIFLGLIVLVALSLWVGFRLGKGD